MKATIKIIRDSLGAASALDVTCGACGWQLGRIWAKDDPNTNIEIRCPLCDSSDRESLYYPEARNWMWTHCEYLGGFKCPDTGDEYDLGVYRAPGGQVSLAIVFGNEPGDYLSGNIELCKNSKQPAVVETLKRLTQAREGWIR